MVRDAMLSSGASPGSASGQPGQAQEMITSLPHPLNAPDGGPSFALLRHCHLTVRIISLLVSSAGLLVLSGWLFDVAAFKSVLPGAATMKPNTALCFVLAGAALWALHIESAAPGKAVRRWTGQACAALISLIA